VGRLTALPPHSYLDLMDPFAVETVEQNGEGGREGRRKMAE